jgi:hypothetical protein
MLNGLLSRPVRWVPCAKRILPGRRLVVCLGVVGNIAVGAAATTATWWLPIERAGAGMASSEVALVLASIAHLAIGFLTARWVTSERDRAVLRGAVYTAAMAPAAHPDTIRAFERASADTIYDTVQQLIPRRMTLTATGRITADRENRRHPLISEVTG